MAFLTPHKMFDTEILLRDGGVLHANREILKDVFWLFDGLGDCKCTSDSFDLTECDYPPEVTVESLRYTLAFVYSIVMLPEVEAIRNGPAPTKERLKITLDYFGASDALTRKIEWHQREKLKDVPTFEECIENNDISLVKWMMQVVSIPSEALITAYGHTEIVKFLLDRVTDQHVMHANNSGNTALIKASKKGRTEIVKLLLDRVTDQHVMHADDDSNTALIKASQKGHTEIVKLLLDRVTDQHVMHVANDDGQTALIAASDEGNTEIVKLLLDRVTDQHVMHANNEGSTALIWASYQGDTEIVKLLLDRVTNQHVMHEDNSGNTSLIWASYHGHTEIVKLLLDRVTNQHVMHANDSGNTALIWASSRGHTEVVELLHSVWHKVSNKRVRLA